MKVKLSNSDLVLSKYMASPSISSTAVEGKDYISLERNSSSTIGKLLYYSHSTRIDTFIGNVRSIRAFMDYITTPNYPLELLSKQRLSKEELSSIPKNRKEIPNYWALCVYVVTERIKQDKYLVRLLKENELPLVYNNKVEKKTLWGKEITVYGNNPIMTKYVAILRYVIELIKSDRFKDEEISNLIDSCKDDPDKDILDGVILPPNIVVSEANTVTE